MSQMFFPAESLNSGVKAKRKSWSYFIYVKHGVIVTSDDPITPWEIWSMDLLANDWEVVA